MLGCSETVLMDSLHMEVWSHRSLEMTGHPFLLLLHISSWIHRPRPKSHVVQVV